MLTVLENNPQGQHIKLIQQRHYCLHICSPKASVAVQYESMSVLITSTSSYRKDPVWLGSLIISPCSYQTLSTDGKITFCRTQENGSHSIRIFFFLKVLPAEVGNEDCFLIEGFKKTAIFKTCYFKFLDEGFSKTKYET